MRPEEFCRWLQGFAELTEAPPTEAQWKSIKEHLQALYVKVTPPVDRPSIKPERIFPPGIMEGTTVC
jgi:hypothetical protein